MIRPWNPRTIPTVTYEAPTGPLPPGPWPNDYDCDGNIRTCSAMFSHRPDGQDTCRRRMSHPMHHDRQHVGFHEYLPGWGEEERT